MCEAEKEEGKENVTLLFTVQGFSWKTEDRDIISNWFSEDKGDTQLEFKNVKTRTHHWSLPPFLLCLGNQPRGGFSAELWSLTTDVTGNSAHNAQLNRRRTQSQSAAIHLQA